MKRTRLMVGQIITMLREAEVDISHGKCGNLRAPQRAPSKK
jgi:hypothetical protein